MIKTGMLSPDPTMSEKTFRHHFVVMIAMSVTCGVALVAVGYYPTMGRAGSAGVAAMCAGVGVSLAASVMGSLLVAHALAGPKDKVPLAILGGTCLRFCAVLFLVAPLAYFEMVARVPFVLWVGISYLIFLFADTLLAVHGLRDARGRNG